MRTFARQLAIIGKANLLKRIEKRLGKKVFARPPLMEEDDARREGELPIGFRDSGRGWIDLRARRCGISKKMNRRRRLECWECEGCSL